MSDLKYSHVGRPTNEEVAIRKNKKNVKILLIVLLTLFVFGGITLFLFKDKLDFSSVMGNSAVKNNHNKYIIIVGASQVTRMTCNKMGNKDMNQHLYCINSLRSSNNLDYSFKNGNLIYINKSGSGITYQISQNNNVGEGYKLLVETVSNIFKNNSNAEVHVFFPLSGNTIKNFVCEGDSKDKYYISKDNAYIKNFIKGYSDAIVTLRNSRKSNNQKVFGYVTSMHPDDPRPGENKKISKFVVYNNNKNSCSKNYRSNRKYYKFNKSVMSLVNNNYKDTLIYQPLFREVMNIKDENRNYSYKIKYSTYDGVHWDESTTKKWLQMMVDYSGNL